MQSITDFKLLNKKPVIRLTTKTIQSIKHIVSIAPEEAQWFHTVSIDDQDSNNLYIDISEKLYIPKQNTSWAQVNTTSSMMIEFYNELKEEYQDQRLINEKLNSMSCWCHSHHNMSPAPSTQDVTQFNLFVENALKQNQKGWHLMLIFNKKDEFYAKAFNSENLSFYEGLKICIKDNFDFDYIDRAAKEKFIKTKQSALQLDQQLLFQNKLFNSTVDIENSIAQDFIDTFFPKTNKLNSKLKINQDLFISIADWFVEILDEREIVAFRLILEKNFAEISNVLDEFNFQHLNYDISKELDFIYEIFKSNKITLKLIKSALMTSIKLDDFETLRDLLQYLKGL